MVYDWDGVRTDRIRKIKAVSWLLLLLLVIVGLSRIAAPL